MKYRFLVLISSIAFISDASLSAPGSLMCVTAQYYETGLEVKAEPSSDAKTVMVIGAGRKVMEFGRKNGWMSVGVDRSGGKDGYIPIEAVSSRDLDGMACGS